MAKPPKLCTVNMRDPSKRDEFGLKLDDLTACHQISASAAGQHPDRAWEELRTVIHDAALGNLQQYSVSSNIRQAQGS